MRSNPPTTIPANNPCPHLPPPLGKAIIQKFGQEKGAVEANRLIYGHGAVLAPASTISHLTRAARKLTDLEQDQLRDAFLAYGVARRTHFPNRKLTPKEILSEDTVNGMMAQVVWYGTIGWFGEDGIEALHPYDTRKRQLVQAIRNPEARHRAHSRLLTAARYTDKLVREIKRRPGKKAA